MRRPESCFFAHGCSRLAPDRFLWCSPFKFLLVQGPKSAAHASFLYRICTIAHSAILYGIIQTNFTIPYHTIRDSTRLYYMKPHATRLYQDKLRLLDPDAESTRHQLEASKPPNVCPDEEAIELTRQARPALGTR